MDSDTVFYTERRTEFFAGDIVYFILCHEGKYGRYLGKIHRVVEEVHNDIHRSSNIGGGIDNTIYRVREYLPNGDTIPWPEDMPEVYRQAIETGKSWIEIPEDKNCKLIDAVGYEISLAIPPEGVKQVFPFTSETCPWCSKPDETFGKSLLDENGEFATFRVPCHHVGKPEWTITPEKIQWCTQLNESPLAKASYSSIFGEGKCFLCKQVETEFDYDYYVKFITWYRVFVRVLATAVKHSYDRTKNGAIEIVYEITSIEKVFGANSRAYLEIDVQSFDRHPLIQGIYGAKGRVLFWDTLKENFDEIVDVPMLEPSWLRKPVVEQYREVLRRKVEALDLTREVVREVKTNAKGKRYFFTRRNEYGNFDYQALSLHMKLDGNFLTISDREEYPLDLETGSIIYVQRVESKHVPAGKTSLVWILSSPPRIMHEAVERNGIVGLDEFLTLMRFGPGHQRFKGMNPKQIVSLLEFYDQPTILSRIATGCFESSSQDDMVQRFIKLFLWWI